jgi:aminopeptidase N
MKMNGLRLIFALVSLLSTSFLMAQPVEFDDGASHCAHTRLQSGKPMPTQLSLAGSMIDLFHAQCSWTINPAQSYIKGDVLHRFRVLGGGITAVTFDLKSQLSVDSVTRNGISLPFTHSNDVISITANWAAAGQSDSVRIWYQGAPGASGFGSFIQSTHAGTPIVWTLSEPYGAMEWWPCKNGLDDKLDSIDVIVTSPKAYRTASNGLLIKDIVSGLNRTCHWKHRYPIATYLVAISVTNYAVYSNYATLQNNATLPILNYVFPEDSANAAANTPNTIGALEFFDSLFHIYPFHQEKYGHAQFGWGGGMEHQTMSFMGGWSYGLIAHELAHMWFGDMVTCGSWADIWLNEGFATYLTGLCYERYWPNTYWPSWKNQTINHVLSAPDGSVFCDDTSSVSRIFSSRLSYSKGAVVLHMLRWVMGDSAFFQGVRNYLLDPAVAYGYALTPDLQYHLEVAHGSSLNEFFNDWYFGQGYPTYNAQVQWLKQGKDYHVFLNQTQSHSSVSFFEMPVPIRFYGSAGQDTLVVFNHQSNGQMWTVTMPFMIDSARFDPDRWLCATYSGVSVGLDQIVEESQVKLYPNPAADIIYLEGVSAADVIGLFDHAGRLYALPLEQGSGRISIDISVLSPGNYLLQLKGKDALKLVKH